MDSEFVLKLSAPHHGQDTEGYTLGWFVDCCIGQFNKNNDAIYAIRSKSKLNSRFAIELRYGKAKGCKSIGNLVAITLVLLQIELYMRDTWSGKQTGVELWKNI